MSSPARMATDPAAASTIAAGADYAVVQNLILVQRGDSRVMDLERVGMFPGPRSCADTKNLSVLIAVVQPLVDAHDYEPKPIFLDLWSTARDAGGNGAEILTRAKIALIHATLEYLFKRANHGDLRVLPDAAFLPSV
ncbi:unnamed protein product [Ectocarpus sp. CCAP 1310/34]|nr:unnamed protein product [Ectocarpus sp. CCAP 1310/34]